jgi:hypothetical protein
MPLSTVLLYIAIGGGALIMLLYIVSALVSVLMGRGGSKEDDLC